MSLVESVKHRIWQYLLNFADLAIAPSKILVDIHEYYGVLKGKWKVVVPWTDPVFHSLGKSRGSEKGVGNKEFDAKKLDRCLHDGPILLFVGSLIEFKGAWVAAKALKKIVDMFPKAQLVFVGNEQDPGSKYRKDIEKICTKDGTAENIVFLGRRSKEEIAYLHKRSSVYLCPTVCMESFGLNWAEAMLASSPIVASAIGSIPEYIKDGKTGFLFTPRDHKELASCVIKVLSDKKLAKNLAKDGKNYAQRHFTVERATDEIVALYKKLLD